MNRYPTANSIMNNLIIPFTDEVKLINEFIEGRNNYQEKAERLGEASEELTRTADFIKFFLENRKKETTVYFGKEAFGNAYIHNHDQIHIQKPDLIIGLHEVGHAIYGESELMACIFSTSLILATKKMKNKTPIFINHKLINQI